MMRMSSGTGDVYKLRPSNCLALVIIAVFSCIVLPNPQKTFAYEFPKPLIPVTKDFTLPNGLRVVLSEDHSVPVSALAIVYDVGACNEEKGRSGFAHLFEHMMFEGSENVGKTEHFKYIEAAGGSFNASTHPDFTNYYDKLPSNQIELALWLESDRMRSLKVTPENFENQLETVKEEKRSRIDNQPYVPAWLKLEETVFDNWANAHPTIGDFKDLEASTIYDVRKFFKTYYAPNNAVMAIVGDFDSNHIEKLVNKYFGGIKRQPAPPKPNIDEPQQIKEKFLKVVDQHAKAPAFWIAWKVPGRSDRDYYALSIIEKLLSSGESSRLYQRLVKGDQIALSADATYNERRGPSMFETCVITKGEETVEKAKEAVWNEIEKLKKQEVSQEELKKAKNQILRGLFSASGNLSLQRCLGRAELLAEYTLFFGDSSLIDKDLDRYMQVSAKDVQLAAQRRLTKQGSTTLVVEPVNKERKGSVLESKQRGGSGGNESCRSGSSGSRAKLSGETAEEARDS